MTTMWTAPSPQQKSAAPGAPDQSPAPEAASAITVETVLWAGILLLALATRLFALGATPFSPAEAAASWPAWLDATALHFDRVAQPDSALLHAMQTLLFWTAGRANETLARLPVALVASVIPMLPWFWRNRLTREGALLLALFLALDPWVTTLGRTAAASALSATLALVALTALERMATRGDAARLSAAIAAAALGLLLVSGPQAWTWVLVLLLYLLLVGHGLWRALLGLRFILIFAAAALFGATGWLAQPQELGMVSESLSAWLAQFSTGDYGLGYPWLRLAVDQPFVFLFGIGGLVGLWRAPLGDEARQRRLFLSAWLALAVLLLLAPGRSPYSLPLLGIPMAVCAALATAWLIRAIASEGPWSEGVLVTLLILVIMLAVLFRATNVIWDAATMERPFGVVLAMVALIVLIFVGYAIFVSRQQALLLALALTGAALVIVAIGSTVQLAFRDEAHYPDGFFQTTATPSARTLAEDVAALSDRRTGDPTQMPVVVATGPSGAPSPQVGWLLRNMRNLRFVMEPAAPTLGELAGAPLVITQDQNITEWNSALLGAHYNLAQDWLPSYLPPAAGQAGNRWASGVRPWLRWLVYREAMQVDPRGVALWATP